ncbi:hypothetical protein BDP27DRAFT_1427653 [Rhodocollybia butyracea]|uniref:Uncharacterized protein n=1 Tax=Rhodocollybia butyracea TaxID=206335 RepID=A0A9P5U1P3_9AGAR|nr:hypothetical protein BDP27DRAFT_1427653 [Rhodocollybia butyracea]
MDPNPTPKNPKTRPPRHKNTNKPPVSSENTNPPPKSHNKKLKPPVRRMTSLRYLITPNPNPNPALPHHKPYPILIHIFQVSVTLVTRMGYPMPGDDIGTALKTQTGRYIFYHGFNVSLHGQSIQWAGGYHSDTTGTHNVARSNLRKWIYFTLDDPERCTATGFCRGFIARGRTCEFASASLVPAFLSYSYIPIPVWSITTPEGAIQAKWTDLTQNFTGTPYIGIEIVPGSDTDKPFGRPVVDPASSEKRQVLAQARQRWDLG